MESCVGRNKNSNVILGDNQQAIIIRWDANTDKEELRASLVLDANKNSLVLIRMMR